MSTSSLTSFHQGTLVAITPLTVDGEGFVHSATDPVQILVYGHKNGDGVTLIARGETGAKLAEVLLPWKYVRLTNPGPPLVPPTDICRVRQVAWSVVPPGEDAEREVVVGLEIVSMRGEES